MESVQFSPSSCNLSIPSPITPPLSALISPDGTDQTHLPSIADIPPHLLIIFKGSQTLLLMEKFRFDLKEGAGMLVHYNAIYLLNCGRADPKRKSISSFIKGKLNTSQLTPMLSQSLVVSPYTAAEYKAHIYRASYAENKTLNGGWYYNNVAAIEFKAHLNSS